MLTNTGVPSVHSSINLNTIGNGGPPLPIRDRTPPRLNIGTQGMSTNMTTMSSQNFPPQSFTKNSARDRSPSLMGPPASLEQAVTEKLKAMNDLT